MCDCCSFGTWYLLIYLSKYLEAAKGSFQSSSQAAVSCWSNLLKAGLISTLSSLYCWTSRREAKFVLLLKLIKLIRKRNLVSVH